jgi:hypothetical protein
MHKRILKIRIQKLTDQGQEEDLLNTTPAERLSMMWQLAVDTWLFKGESIAQSRLPRHVVSVVRGER